ncbi:domain of Kin17 curved DNA-binding protein-domain-containing protein [Scheffersomyces xylosifermentans]|uniref:domain of Kin17 curved DNA-binding protein-domain-containing protein n=1 Tax=Scheffersomyces xylosifermentans TaxID=1304137 RepID=UPI00315CC037
MARAEVGSAKYQSKKLKAAGLQKLKFYCQLCEKQCRDANGFKNHLSSPSHQNKIVELSESGNGNKIVDEYSSQFEQDFLRLLKVNHGTKRVNANKYYQEYILNDKDHVHMNSTRWTSLTSFIKYLGQKGLVRVEEANPGAEDEFNLEIRLVDQSLELQQQQKALQKESSIRTDEQISLKFINEQIKRGKELAKKSEGDSTPLSVPLASGPVKVTLKANPSTKKTTKSASVFGDDNSDDDDEETSFKPKKTIKIGAIGKRSFPNRR